MLKIDKNEKGKLRDVYIFSDPHYAHKNICRGTTNWRTPKGEIPISQTRDFETVEKMNETIIRNINNVVGQNDVAICLGDWSFSGFETIREFRERLIVKEIHLILGNHDDFIERNRGNIREIFTTVTHYNRLELDEYKFELLHYPISSWRNMKRGSMMLHGHCHLPPNKRFGIGKRMDIGLDSHPEFRPYHIIREIVPLLKNRPIVSEISDDHHIDGMLNVDESGD